MASYSAQMLDYECIQKLCNPLHGTHEYLIELSLHFLWDIEDLTLPTIDFGQMFPNVGTFTMYMILTGFLSE
ncbi:hypothetical protein CVT26_009782, partial [Gymnopilus dilepis]